MNFQDAKDELLKWLVPLLLGGMFYELQGLNNAMIEQKAKVVFVEYRIDQHRNLLLDHTAKIAEHDVRLGILMSQKKDR